MVERLTVAQIRLINHPLLQRIGGNMAQFLLEFTKADNASGYLKMLGPEARDFSPAGRQAIREVIDERRNDKTLLVVRKPAQALDFDPDTDIDNNLPDSSIESGIIPEPPEYQAVNAQVSADSRRYIVANGRSMISRMYSQHIAAPEERRIQEPNLEAPKEAVSVILSNIIKRDIPLGNDQTLSGFMSTFIENHRHSDVYTTLQDLFLNQIGSIFTRLYQERQDLHLAGRIGGNMLVALYAAAPTPSAYLIANLGFLLSKADNAVGHITAPMHSVDHIDVIEEMVTPSYIAGWMIGEVIQSAQGITSQIAQEMHDLVMMSDLPNYLKEPFARGTTAGTGQNALKYELDAAAAANRMSSLLQIAKNKLIR